jgi:hypothetical protein
MAMVFPDILIGANFFSTDTGRAYIFHGAAGSPGMGANTTINGLAGVRVWYCIRALRNLKLSANPERRKWRYFNPL